jgi:hypothetical protein
VVYVLTFFSHGLNLLRVECLPPDMRHIISRRLNFSRSYHSLLQVPWCHIKKRPEVSIAQAHSFPSSGGAQTMIDPWLVHCRACSTSGRSISSTSNIASFSGRPSRHCHRGFSGIKLSQEECRPSRFCILNCLVFP